MEWIVTNGNGIVCSKDELDARREFIGMITGVSPSRWHIIVKDINNLQETIRKAFFIAREGRPGPVLIDIPKDITSNKTEYKDLKPLDLILEKCANTSAPFS